MLKSPVNRTQAKNEDKGVKSKVNVILLRVKLIKHLQKTKLFHLEVDKPI